MFPVYAPEASDNASLPARETKQKSLIIAAWKETLSALLSKFRQANNSQEAVRTLNEAGRLQLVWSSTKDAFDTFQQSYDLLDQNVDSVTRVDTLNGLAAAYAGLNQYLKAQPLVEEARTISDQNNYPAGKAEALLLLGGDELEHVRLTDVSEEVARLDEVVARVEVAGVLEREREPARLGVDAQPGRLAVPVGEGNVEHLHVHLADVAAGPFLEHVDQEPPVPAG